MQTGLAWLSAVWALLAVFAGGIVATQELSQGVVFYLVVTLWVGHAALFQCHRYLEVDYA